MESYMSRDRDYGPDFNYREADCCPNCMFCEDQGSMIENYYICLNVEGANGPVEASRICDLFKKPEDV